MLQETQKGIRNSMGLKFVIALSSWIALLMLVGTIFVARFIVNNQERDVRARARDMGGLLGKATIDRIIAGDLIGLNILVEDVAKSPDIVSVIFTNTNGLPITSARASFNQRNPAVKAIIERLKTEDVQKLSAAVRGGLDPIETAVDIMLEGAKLGEVRLSFSRATVRSGTVAVVLLLLATSLVIVLSLSVLMYFMVRKMIVVPTRAAQAVATKIAEGDLTQHVRVSTNDEIGALGRGLNGMIIGLKGMIGSVRDAARRLEGVSTDVAGVSANVTAASTVQSESVEEAASSVNEMHYALKEIAGSVEDLNTTTEETTSAVIETAASIDEVARTMADLSSSIEETSTAITQMSAAVRNIAENVSSLTGLIDETSAAVAEVSASVREVEANAAQSVSLAEAVATDAQDLGMRSVEKTIDGMRMIEEETRRSAEVIDRLGSRAENIGGILTVIEDITDQTSLLALNAAILAAQAGEHGKGFAVVASEIRELATRTAASTREIANLIVSVQEESREAVEVMQKGRVLAEGGMHLVNEAGDALRKILARADQSRAMSHSISRAAGEQARSMQQVSAAIEGITGMSHQIANATAEQRGGSEQIMRAAERMREITRFVRAATAEQVTASSGITTAVETMSIKVGLVNRASGEVRAGSDLIVRAIDRIKATARENAELASRLNSAVEVMTAQTTALNQEIGRFATNGAGD